MTATLNTRMRMARPMTNRMRQNREGGRVGNTSFRTVSRDDDGDRDDDDNAGGHACVGEPDDKTRVGGG